MIRTLTLTATALVALAGLAASAQASAQPYAGQQSREIAALSAQDVEDLLAGRGWGLAKPAERLRNELRQLQADHIARQPAQRADRTPPPIRLDPHTLRRRARDRCGQGP